MRVSERTPLLGVKQNNSPTENASHPRRLRRDLVRPVVLLMVLAVSCHGLFQNSKQPLPLWSSSCGTAAQVWLIRHGEKSTNVTNVDDMYGLSERGWQRAHYLASLVKESRWPRFGAVFATKYASQEQIQHAWPHVVLLKGQSMVKREYQTVLPLAKELNLKVNVSFAKHELHQVAMAATQASLDMCGVPVLISWDHCSLPTLIVRGFGCANDNERQPSCQRCWADDRFDDVLILEVTLQKNVTDNDLSSTPIKMTKECFEDTTEPKDKDNPAEQSMSSTVSLQLPSNERFEQPVNDRGTAPCVHSYCTDRPEAATMVKCVCIEPGQQWRPLVDTEQ